MPFAQYRIEADAPQSAPHWATIIEAQLLLACTDAGVLDAGPIDAGVSDAGPNDAGAIDAGRASDAGVATDAGDAPGDGGAADAGAVDSARAFGVGWGCRAIDGRWLTALLVVAPSVSRRARSRRSMSA